MTLVHDATRRAPGAVRPTLVPDITIDRLAVARSLATAGVVAVAIAEAGAGTPRWLIACLAVAATAHVALRRFRRARLSPLAQTLTDLLVVNAVALAVPAMWTPCVLWAAALSAAAAVLLRARAAVVVSACSVGGTIVTAILADVHDWQVTILCQIPIASTVLVAGALLRVELAVNEAELADAASAAGAIVTYIDLDRNEVVGSLGDAERVIGYDHATWQTMDRRSIIHPDDVETFWLDAEDRPRSGPFERIARIRHGDGTWRWIRDVSRIDVDEAGRRTLRGLFFDVTELESSRRHLITQARSDPVTGLSNRVAANELLERAIAAGRPFALAVLDLDRFKEINDTLGHEAGDRVLAIVGARLLDALGPDDHLARLGGDEFAVVFGGGDVGEERVNATLAALAEAGAAPVTVHGIRLATSMSVGVAFSGAGDDATTLMRHADIAMYDAKRHNRRCRTFDASLEHTSTRSLSLSAALPDAVRDGGIRMYFQPQFDLRDRRLVGAEALIRWHHDDGVLTPDAFLEMALLSESAAEVAACTIDQTAAMLAVAAARGHPIPIAVNLAARSILDVEFVSIVADAVARHGADPRLLVVEITESDAMPASDEVLRRLDLLARLGVHVSVDDFGTGHSSLARLRDLHVDELKIDREFVERIGDSERDRNLVRSVIALAGRLGCRVVAEGIERADQVATLTALGCTTGQGYLFARPMPAHEFGELLAASSRQLDGVVVGDDR